jgi:serine/threonine protein kinase
MCRDTECVRARTHSPALARRVLCLYLMSDQPPQLGMYRVSHVIGEGGMARVFMGHHVALGRPVAIKALREPFSSHPHANEIFLREARLACSVRHPNLVEIYDFGADADGRCYCVMELLEGQSLSSRLHASPLPMSRCLTIGLEIARALAAVHAAGIVHRDVKPANVFLARGDGGEIAKLIDFGVAKPVAEPAPGLIPDHVLVGSPDYMAPEQVAGDPVDHRTDVYAFGVLLHEMVLGAPPFNGHSLRTLLVQIVSEDVGPLPRWLPDGLGELMMDCLRKDPADRPASMDVVHARLAAVTAQYRRGSAAIDWALDEAEDDSLDALDAVDDDDSGDDYAVYEVRSSYEVYDGGLASSQRCAV